MKPSRSSASSPARSPYFAMQKAVARLAILVLLASLASTDAGAKELDQLFPKPTNAEDWRFIDRAAFTRARRTTTIVPAMDLGRPGSEFFQALLYNTRENKAAEYQTVAQRQAYYEMLAVLLATNSGDPFNDSMRCIKFFDAAARVTDKHQVGVFENSTFEKWVGERLGLIPQLTQAEVDLLLAINKRLFGDNLGVISKILYKWKEPRDPNSSSVSRISALEFDLKMVRFEQTRVQEELDRYEINGDAAAIARLNGLFRAQSWLWEVTSAYFWGLSGLDFNLTNQLLTRWLPVLGIEKIDFLELEHRIALGEATIFQLHGLTSEDHKSFRAAKVVPTSKCAWVDPQSDEADSAELRAATAVAALSREPTGIAIATVAAADRELKQPDLTKKRVSEITDSAKSVLRKLLEAQSSNDYFDVISSESAKSINLAAQAGSVFPVAGSLLGRDATALDGRFSAVSSITKSLASATADTNLWGIITSATGLTKNTSAAYLSRLPIAQPDGALTKTLALLASKPDESTLKKYMEEYLTAGIGEFTGGVAKLGKVPNLGDLGSFNASGSQFESLQAVAALSAFASLVDDPKLVQFTKNVSDAAHSIQLLNTAINAVSTGGVPAALALLSGGGSIPAATLSSSLLGQSPGSAAAESATLQSINALRELLIRQFAIVNAKLDLVLAKIDILQLNSRQILERLADLQAAVTRIDERLSRMEAMNIEGYTEIAKLISKTGVTTCQIKLTSKLGIKLDEKEYADCVGPFTDYLEAAQNPILTKCPSPAFDSVGFLQTHIERLGSSEVWEYSDLACYIGRVAHQSAGWTVNDYQIPSLTILRQGSDNLLKLKEHNPKFWALTGPVPRKVIASTISAIDKVSQIQEQRFGKSHESTAHALKELYSGLVTKPTSAFAGALDGVWKTVNDEWAGRFVDDSVRWFADANAKSKGDEEHPTAYLPPFRTRYNGISVPICSFPSGHEYMPKIILVPRTSVRTAWKAPLAVLRAVQDDQINVDNLPFYDYEDRTVCYRLTDFDAWESIGNKNWRFKFEIVIQGGGVLGQSNWVELIGQGSSFSSAFASLHPKFFYDAFYSTVEAALANGESAFRERAKALVEQRYKGILDTGGPYAAMFYEYRRDQFLRALPARRAELLAHIDEMAIKRKVLRAYLGLVLPEMYRKSDALRLFLDQSSIDGLASLTNVRRLERFGTVAACGAIAGGGPRTISVAKLLDECEARWAKILENIQVGPTQQWRYHFDLWQSKAVLESLR